MDEMERLLKDKKVVIKCEGADLIALESLLPLQGELKELSQDNYTKLFKSIVKNGFIAPFFVWNNDGKQNLLDGKQNLLDGHQRLNVLREMKQSGWEVPLLPVSWVYADNLGDAKQKLLQITSSYGQITPEGLSEFSQDIPDFKDMLSDFKLPDFDISNFTGSFHAEILPPKEGEDDVPELTEDPITKRGDVWLLGSHRLVCGDSTIVSDVEKLMQDNKASFLFTSPPYSDMRDYNGGKDLSICNLIDFIPTYYGYTDYQVVNLDIQRKDGEIVEYWQDYIGKAKECGYKLISWNVWDKGEAGSIGNQTAMFSIEHEWIFVFGKKPFDLNKTIDCKYAATQSKSNTTRNRDGSVSKNKDRIIGNKKGMGTVYKTGALKARNLDNNHPAAFTVDFAQGYIEAMSNEEDIVIEPFCGSGSTLIACEKTKRICYSMEMDEKYCDVIIKRYLKYTERDDVTLESTGEKYTELKKARDGNIQKE